MTKVIVTEADTEVVKKIIDSEPILKERLLTNDIDDIEIKSCFYVLNYKDKNILFTCSYVDKGFYEVHIAANKNNIQYLKLLSLLVMYWILYRKHPEAKGLFTYSNYKSMSNFITKLGFKKVKEDDSYDYFIYLKSVQEN